MNQSEDLFHLLGRSKQHTIAGNMFGWRCYKIGRKPFVFYDEDSHDGMVFKLPKPLIESAKAEYDAVIFNPGKKSKPMKNWVVVGFANRDAWESLLDASYQYVLEEIESGK